MKIYVFGNPSLKEDSLPLQILPDLRKNFPRIDFKIVDPNEDFPPQEKKIFILDTVAGIKEPTLLDLNDLEEIKRTPISPHDYDLLMHLLLLKKLKKIHKAVIIGIPQQKTISLSKIYALLNSLQTTDYNL